MTYINPADQFLPARAASNTITVGPVTAANITSEGTHLSLTMNRAAYWTAQLYDCENGTVDITKCHYGSTPQEALDKLEAEVIELLAVN
jgi:hypothetical protein